jgi:hypothetical protein
MSLLSVIAGFLVTMALGLGARPYVEWATRSLSLELPPTASDEHRRQWNDLTEGGEGGAAIGWLERFMFFAAFMADGAAPLVIGGWLTFKVASKWNAWTNITAVPKEVKDVTDLDLAIGRRRWASHVLTTFLFGTAYNICVGMVGATVARNFEQLSKLVGY